MRIANAFVLLVALAGCKTASPPIAPAADPPAAPAPPRDPRVELARQHDEYWKHLETTYDRDQDRKVARAEYPRGDATFARLDRDRDGELTRQDFERDLIAPVDLVAPVMLVRLAAAPDSMSVRIEVARDVLLAMDRNGDGRLSRPEFEGALPEARIGPLGVDAFGTLVSGMDADRDALLSRAEIGNWLERRDTDGDGELALRERTATGPPPKEGFLWPMEREPAPDFVATSLADGRPVALSSLVGRRPLVVVFGSFT